MIGVGFKIEVKKTKALTEPGRVLALPMLGLMQHLAQRVLARVQSGQGPTGPWDTYGGSPTQGDALLWVAPGRPQPGTEGPREDGGLVFRVKTGRWAGWAAYASADGYYRLTGKKGQPHTFVESGRLLKAASIRQINPRHMRLAFFGGHGKMSAKQVAWLASKDESQPLLMLSKAEVEEAQRYVAEHVNNAIIEAARMGAQSQGLMAASRGITRRASKLLGD